MPLRPVSSCTLQGAGTPALQWGHLMWWLIQSSPPSPNPQRPPGMGLETQLPHALNSCPSLQEPPVLAGQNSSPDPEVTLLLLLRQLLLIWCEDPTEPCTCFPKAGTRCRPAPLPWWGAWWAWHQWLGAVGRGRRGVALTYGHSPKGARPGQRAGSGIGTTVARFLASLWRA